MEEVALHNIRQSEGLLDALYPLKQKIEKRLNLKEYRKDTKYIALNNNLLQRLTLAAGLSLNHKRN